MSINKNSLINLEEVPLSQIINDKSFCQEMITPQNNNNIKLDEKKNLKSTSYIH